MPSNAVVDGLRDALGQVIANERREWRRERDLITAEAGRLAAEAGRTIAELKAQLIEMRTIADERLANRLAELRDGADGAPGTPGAPGDPGAPGPPGEPGPPGQDGREWTPRGLYDPAGAYGRGDVVTLEGGCSVAIKDDPGACPGDGWRAIVMRGKPGQRGERGERGPDGAPGAVLEAGRFNLQTMTLELVRGDGTTVAIDAYAFADMIRRSVD